MFVVANLELLVESSCVLSSLRCERVLISSHRCRHICGITNSAVRIRCRPTLPPQLPQRQTAKTAATVNMQSLPVISKTTTVVLSCEPESHFVLVVLKCPKQRESTNVDDFVDTSKNCSNTTTATKQRT